MTKGRRDFLKKSVKAATASSIYPYLISCGGKKNQENKLSGIIDRIELFRYDINIPRYFSFGTWHNRQHLMMKVTSGEHSGWSEVPAAFNNPEFKPAEWADFIRPFKNMQIDKALEKLAVDQAPGTEYAPKQLELIEFSLLDLAGRLKAIPSIEMLNLKGNGSVPGLFCILNKDIKDVSKNARLSVEEGLSDYIKIKMFAEKDLDIEIIKTVRSIIGKNSTVISDINNGYDNTMALEDLAGILKEYHANGLDAVEDPSNITPDQYIKLQKMVGNLSLIPDFPMRPAWDGLKNIKKGMGRMFNFHPSWMGSIRDAAKLAIKVKSFGGKIMIGDDSLAGPGCTAWQQIAIGLDAVWVEAIEKTGDSDAFNKCIVSKATYRNAAGKFSLNPKPGFGLEVDSEKLKSICPEYLDI